MKTKLFIKGVAITGLALFVGWTAPGQAQEYQIDPTHSFVEFSISHLGISLLKGRFNDISGHFNYEEENPSASRISVLVKTASIDSNHAERDKHLRDPRFLHVAKYPDATFTTTSFEGDGKTGTLIGQFTLHGTSKTVTIPVTYIGAGKDPWGGYRRGFEGHLTINRLDYGVSQPLGPASEEMQLGFFIEGIRK
ncbi:MAG: YceI family protein [Magnetococcales bacterium]|nr:YceI family protein [Magnetococcales bacterium]